MSRIKKVLGTSVAAVAVAGVLAVSTPSVASASAGGDPNARTMSFYVPAYYDVYPGTNVRSATSYVRDGASYAYAWAWSTNPGCSLYTYATLDPYPSYRWSVTC